MLADPLSVVDAVLDRRTGRLAVGAVSLLVAALLLLLDRRVFRETPVDAKMQPQRRSRRELIRHYEAMAIHGCLKLCCLAATLLALTYLARVFFANN